MKTNCTACGADSEAPDFCDQCGAALTGSAPAVQPSPAPVPSNGGGELCPTCDEQRVDAGQYCEACGYDFVNRSGPQAPVPQPASPVVTPDPAPSPTPTPAAGTQTWWAIVTSDRAWYERSGFQAEGIEFPDDYLPRQFPLADAQVRIGRKAGGGIDLSSLPRDGALSGEHATLIRETDGSFHLVDYKSSNGTFANGDTVPLAKGVAIPLADGDFVNVGAWTRITFEKR